jgi:hypothetical protein
VVIGSLSRYSGEVRVGVLCNGYSGTATTSSRQPHPASRGSTGRGSMPL